jgi:DNA-binding transcriptional regulator GbsR (MarR family)
MPSTESNAPKITPAMASFLDYFEELGPRWGLDGETTKLHGLLYLVGEPLNLTQMSECLKSDKKRVQVAIDDLTQWGVLQIHSNETWSIEGEPWDLMFSAVQERQKREIAPAKAMLADCLEKSQSESDTPYKVKRNITSLQTLVLDLESISKRTNNLSSNTFKNLVGAGGRAARFIDKVLK